MPWDGNGNYTNPHDWTTDRDSNVNPSADKFDEQDASIADGINNCLTKDGQNAATQNLPMGGNRHIGVGNAAARTDYPATGQVQDSKFHYGVDTGAANAYAIGPSPNIQAYAAGQVFRFIAANANTGASTLAVSGLAAKSIKINGGTIDTPAGAIKAGTLVEVIYDGTVFQLAAQTTYEHLNANGDVGTGAGQLAQGSHNHSGVYEPADATILKDADIGGSVHPYMANASTAEMEAGTETANRAMSPSDVFAGVDAYGGMHKIAEWSHTVDVASVDFTDLGEYSALHLFFSVSHSTTTSLNLQFSDDNGATFKTDYRVGYLVDAGSAWSASSSIVIGASSAAANAFLGIADIAGLNDSAVTTWVKSITEDPDSNQVVVRAGRPTGAGADNAIKVLVGTGVMTTGSKIILYGCK